MKDGSGLNVLVVEDEFLIADYIQLVLEDAGHTVVGMASNAAGALKLLEGAAADVALLDIKIEGTVDGVDLAHELRRLYGLPFVFISGSGDPGTYQRAKAAAPLAFLQKPLNTRELAKILDGLGRGRP